MDGGGGDRSPSPPSPAAYLPDELVLEILARLPAKSLRRFKSVSRSWRGLISDPANRSRFAQTLSGFFFHPAALEGPPWRFCGLSSPGAADGGGGLSTVETALSFLPSSRGEMELLDSCNGLLLLRCCSPTPPSSRGSPPAGPAQASCFYVVCSHRGLGRPAAAEPSPGGVQSLAQHHLRRAGVRPGRLPALPRVPAGGAGGPVLRLRRGRGHLLLRHRQMGSAPEQVERPLQHLLRPPNGDLTERRPAPGHHLQRGLRRTTGKLVTSEGVAAKPSEVR
jgi:hypothetical protein